MATNRNIVATRKLNKKNKARLGRGGDTKIREVGGRDSHVNALEAYLIDVINKAGEDYAKRVGSGTTNPLTGMPEYHNLTSMHKHIDQYGMPVSDPLSDEVVGYMIGNQAYDSGGNEATIEGLAGNTGTTQGTFTPGNNGDNNVIDEWVPPTGRQTYETLSGYDPEQLEKYLQSEFDMADDSMQYIEGFKEEPFGFLGEGKALSEKGLESAYGATMGTLGRTTGRGFREAGKSRDIATSRSGLATSGTITQAYETQKKDLLQDYTAGSATALETLQLGKEGADLDFRQAEYLEKQRQLDELYADVAAVP